MGTNTESFLGPIRALLDYATPFGPRYQITYNGAVLTPAALLKHLQERQDPVLDAPYSLWHVPCPVNNTEDDVSHWESTWEIHVHLSEQPIVLETDAPWCYIEDVLDLERVYEWLTRRPFLEPVAVLSPGQHRSSFLATYYQDVLGVLPPLPDDMHLPLWYSYVELLIDSVVHPDARNGTPIPVCASTLAQWISILHAVYTNGSEEDGAFGDDAQGSVLATRFDEQETA